MTWFSKAASWVGKNVKAVASVALPIAATVVGLVSPQIGAGIGKLADKIGNKIADVTGIGDGKPGIFGIGDGLPGVFGIGTGKGAADTARQAVEAIEAIKAKVKGGVPLTVQESAILQTTQANDANAKNAAGNDMKKEGINPLYIFGGGILALLALRRSPSID